MRRTIYFPGAGQRGSPKDFIDQLPPRISATIVHRLRAMEQLQPHQWPWVRHIEGKLWEIKVGDYRLFYCLDADNIVVLHACKKVKRKTSLRDRQRALAHQARYLDWRGTGSDE